jgi:hypothetical protein
MQSVGIDLGTTNIRISTWDPDNPTVPARPLAIGAGDSYIMPAVIAFRRQPGGEIETVVGEDADSLNDGPNQVVVRNVKRYAVAEDLYVLRHLKSRGADWPSWWNPVARCVQVWGQDFPVQGVISILLEEAFLRAGVDPGFEWIAGCPVHSGLKYRSELARAITELGGNGRGEVSRIVEEPILFLALAHQLRTLEPGSYLVFDLGGGSFDCALAQINDDREMTVYGADGIPTLGGSNIDDLLADAIGYGQPDNLLRLAKEQVTPADPQRPNGKTLTWQNVVDAVKEGCFISMTTLCTRAAYRDAKTIWRREDPNAPVGEVIKRNPTTGQVKFVEQLNWDDMTHDLDGIILYGGPTKSPLFSEALRERFGGKKIISAHELIPDEIPDPELTAISAGACYAVGGQYIPLFVNRLPARITLEDLQTGQELRYEPYEHFSSTSRHSYEHFSSTSRHSLEGFISEQTISEDPGDPHVEGRYQLTVTTTEGVVQEQRVLNKDYINTSLIGSKLRLVINRLGQVGVEQDSEKGGPRKTLILESPPWQAGAQLAALNQLQENYRRRRELDSAQLHYNLTHNPFGWQETSG